MKYQQILSILASTQGVSAFQPAADKSRIASTKPLSYREAPLEPIAVSDTQDDVIVTTGGIHLNIPRTATLPLPQPQPEVDTNMQYSPFYADINSSMPGFLKGTKMTIVRGDCNNINSTQRGRFLTHSQIFALSLSLSLMHR